MAHNVLAPFTLIISQENDPQTCPTGQSDRGHSPSESLSFQVTPVCLKWKKNLTTTACYTWRDEETKAGQKLG